jgi:hypothetical protein
VVSRPLTSPTVPVSGGRDHRAIDLRTVDRHPLASVGTLVLGLRCNWCPGSAPMPKLLAGSQRRAPAASCHHLTRLPPLLTNREGNGRNRACRPTAIMRFGCAFPPDGRCRQRFAEWPAFAEPRCYRAVVLRHQARSRPHAGNLRCQRKPRRALSKATQLSGCQCAEPFPSIDVSSLRNPLVSRPPATARAWLCRVAQLTGSHRHFA